MINKQKIAETQYFPIYGFSSICAEINDVARLKQKQEHNVSKYIREKSYHNTHTSIADIIADTTIAQTYKYGAIMYAFSNEQLDLSDVERYLKTYKADKKSSDYRRLICLYDLKRYKQQ